MTTPDRVFRPKLAARVEHTLLGVLAVVVGVAWLNEQLPRWAGFAFVIVGAVIIVRSFRLGVVIRGDHVVNSGLLWSRRIRTAQVTSISGFPALKWTSESGSRRWTPMVGFMRHSPIRRAVADYNLDQVHRISTALDVPIDRD